MKSHTVAAVLVVLLSTLVHAQDYRASWLPDDSKLGAFIGSWSVEGDVKQGNAYGAPAGRYTYVEKYAWRPGHILVQMSRNGQGPAGAIGYDVTLGYYLTTKQYSLIGRDWITGASKHGTGTNEGDTWTFVSVGYLGEGRSFNERCAMNVVPQQSYSVRCDTSPDGGKTWSTAFEGKATRR